MPAPPIPTKCSARPLQGWVVLTAVNIDAPLDQPVRHFIPPHFGVRPRGAPK